MFSICKRSDWPKGRIERKVESYMGIDEKTVLSKVFLKEGRGER